MAHDFLDVNKMKAMTNSQCPKTLIPKPKDWIPHPWRKHEADSGPPAAAHLAEDDVIGAHHQEVAFKLPDNLLLHPVMHV